MEIRKVIILCVVLLTGCATIKPVGLDFSHAQSAIKQDVLEVVVMEDDPVQFFTPGDATGVGASAGIVANVINDLTRPDGSNIALPSTSYLIALILREQLISKRGFNVAEVPNVLTNSNPEKRTVASGRPILEVYVDKRLLSYRPAAWQTYQYMLISHARILNRDGGILWQNKCQIGGVSADKSLQLDRVDFKNDDAKRLKDIMLLAARRCVGNMMSM